MDYIKKTILLTNDKKEISVLSLTKTTNGIFANIKNYSCIKDNCILGICVNGLKVYKQNIVCNKSGGYDFKLSKDFDLNAKIGCVLYALDINKPIMWGVNGDIVNYKGVILEYIQNAHQENTTKANITVNRQVVVKPEPENKNLLNVDNVEKNKTLSCNDNANCLNNIEETKQDLKDIEDTIVKDETVMEHKTNIGKTKELIESEQKVKLYGCRESDSLNAELFDSTDEEVEEIISNELKNVDEPTFFEMISEQLDDLFLKYPEESNLANVVPNSKWVKVNYESNGREYVLGLLYELETVKYVAYGVPAKKDDEVPDSLDGFSQWIPIDPSNIDGDGYFVMFQDAITGDSVKI